MKIFFNIFLFLIFNLYSFYLDAQLIKTCKRVDIKGGPYFDVQVAFMTGYELIENLNIKDAEKVYFEGSKYALIILKEDITIVEIVVPQNDYFLKDLFNTICKFKFTKECLPDLGNSTIIGRTFDAGANVLIHPTFIPTELGLNNPSTMEVDAMWEYFYEKLAERDKGLDILY